MRANKKKTQKLNLIPILDAIFIFIFFLLMSAQFIDVYEFGSDKPITSTLSSEKNKKEPLNLTILIKKKEVEIRTGFDSRLRGRYNYQQMSKFNADLRELKKKHPKEESAILKPSRSIAYKKIVKVIDHTKDQVISGKRVALFDQVIFNTAE